MASLPDPLQQLHNLDRASPHFYEQLSDFLRGDEYQNAVPNLQGEDLAWLVEYLDSVLVGIPNSAGVVFQESLHELREICRAKEVLPKSYTLRIKHIKMRPKSNPQEVKKARP